jgi:transposase
VALTQDWSDGHSQFCENYRRFAKSLKRSMRQIHRAGEKLFIDYAGPTVALSDGSRVSQL